MHVIHQNSIHEHNNKFLVKLISMISQAFFNTNNNNMENTTNICDRTCVAKGGGVGGGGDESHTFLPSIKL